MLIKIQLKNSPNQVIVDDFVYEYLCSNPYLKSIDFVYNLREHSSGRAVFQKSWKQSNGKYKTDTIYLHKFVAENFLKKEEDNEGTLIRIINGNRLDCRIKNLAYSNRSEIKRNTRTSTNKTGYIGVLKEKNRYKAVIYKDRKPIFLGSYTTAEEAALAYNKKSIELFGKTRNLNKVSESSIKKIEEIEQGE
ncbi:Pathogenesis-related transcriptional factor and ERF protein [Flammeovirga agarivorans]|uniref:Pathogenesis-related transcriptional factor and ERF protein n=1 Tax=Flammeovirga agarivorans TaxID=2726742 RepID=A0A7X8SM04_9BACT|nr:Pathogenesis-related transcriptional factor and ERF protein [Flammeovirga agarivorans]NLR92602.1 Pathogenesis-related transcriptional factor and ERF protein [Flammeovirga agarivorans]